MAETPIFPRLGFFGVQNDNHDVYPAYAVTEMRERIETDLTNNRAHMANLLSHRHDVLQSLAVTERTYQDIIGYIKETEELIKLETRKNFRSDYIIQSYENDLKTAAIRKAQYEQSINNAKEIIAGLDNAINTTNNTMHSLERRLNSIIRFGSESEHRTFASVHNL